MTTRRVFGAVLVFVSAGLAVAATFLSAYAVQVPFRGRTLWFESTLWSVEQDDLGPVLALEPLELGTAVVGAAVVMSLSAVVAFRVPAARVGSLLGAGVLAGVAWSAVSGVQTTVRRLQESDLPVPVPFQVGQGPGITLLVVAAGVGVVSAVLHQELPRPQEAGARDGVVIHQIDDEPDDADTPPYGFPVVVEPKNG
ncbi:hypothetical protein [Lentzea sp. NPDC060358]|uniref:hypothetical protein n=1 Tax=Lentzea sp. NPDC060358 TaxID=3347103 RepID=UPI003655E49C